MYVRTYVFMYVCICVCVYEGPGGSLVHYLEECDADDGIERREQHSKEGGTCHGLGGSAQRDDDLL